MNPNTQAQLELRPPVRNAFASHTLDFLGRSFAEDPTDIDDPAPDTEVDGEFDAAVDERSVSRWPWLALALTTVGALGVVAAML